MCSLSVCGWRGAGLPAIGSGLDLDQDFARVDPIALGDVNRLDGPVDGSLNLAFHLHRLTHQHGLTGLDPVASATSTSTMFPGMLVVTCPGLLARSRALPAPPTNWLSSVRATSSGMPSMLR